MFFEYQLSIADFTGVVFLHYDYILVEKFCPNKLTEKKKRHLWPIYSSLFIALVSIRDFIFCFGYIFRNDPPVLNHTAFSVPLVPNTSRSIYV